MLSPVTISSKIPNRPRKPVCRQARQPAPFQSGTNLPSLGKSFGTSSAGSSNFVLHLELADARVLLLDRVFPRDDLERLSLDLVEGAIERGGLAGAGRPGHEHDAVRLVDQLLEDLVMIRRHTDVGEIEDHARLV